MRQSSSPWATAWLDALESYADSGRLQRGRSYAREGRVRRVKIQPGRILADVAGGRSSKYQVFIEAPTVLDDPLVRILLSVVNNDITMGAALKHFPALLPPMDAIDVLCTCPDWGYLCKHAVAVWETVGLRIAESPRVLLTFRGIGVDEGKATVTGTEIQSSAAPAAQAKSPDAPANRPANNPLRVIGSTKRSNAVNAQEFWNGTPDELEATLKADKHRDQAPSWVFIPPVAWPGNHRLPYAEHMAQLYGRMRSEGRKLLDRIEQTKE